MIASSLERFLVECRKTRAKAITLAKGHAPRWRIRVFYLLDGELVLSQWLTVVELHRAPETMKLSALINVHDTVSRRLFFPYFMGQERLNPFEHHLKDGQSATESLFR